jgi:(2Fe-2S) ferredoxin
VDTEPAKLQARRYVVVCRGPHCREHGSLTLRKGLARVMGKREDVRVLGYACFGQCERGPNVVFFPDGEWFGGLNGPNDAEMVAAHATNERPLTALPLSLPDEERQQHLKNIADLIETIERQPPRKRRQWWWPF